MTGGLGEVLVVGARPAGPGPPAGPAACGVGARLIDRGLDRVHESRALAIQPRTLEVLAGLGVTDELVAGGNRAVRLRVHVRGRVLTVPMFDFGLEGTACPFLLLLSQAGTERVLGEYLAAAGGPAERGGVQGGLSNAAAAAPAARRHRDGREEVVPARYVAGCDGGHGSVRRLAGIRFEGSCYPQAFVLADTEADGVEPARRMCLSPRRGCCSFSRSSRRPRGGCWPCGPPPSARHPLNPASSTRLRPPPAPTPAAPRRLPARCGRPTSR